MTKINPKNLRDGKTKKEYKNGGKKKLRLWVKGVLILLVGLGLYTLLAQVMNAINIDKYASEEGHIDDAAQAYYVEGDQGTDVIFGHDAQAMDTVAQGIISDVANGANPHVKIAANYYEANESQIAMDELFKSLSVILYDHEELSSKILKHPSFISYLESNGLSIDEYNKIFEEYKTELYKKIEYPITVQNLLKINSELTNNYLTSFCQKINFYLTPSQANTYINQFNASSEKEINYIINKNNEYYETYFTTQFSDLEKNLNYDIDINNSNFKDFISNYCGKFDSCLLKILNLHMNSENNSNKVFANILIKMYQEFFVNKLIKISELIEEKNNTQNNELKETINELKNNIEKMKEQMNNDKILLENKNKEKSEINKNYFELETKFDKFNRDYKIKLKENENALNIEVQKYSKMEKYYLSQLKEKEKMINTLENKLDKINKEMQSSSKENSMKINELNRENNRLLNEVERIKDIKNKNGDYGMGQGSDKNININSLLKTVNKNFIDFKESVDNLKNENDSIQKNKYLELSKEEIDTKLNNVLNDVKNFCTNQIKTVSDNYEKLLKKAKTDFEELNFELSKKDFALNEQMLLKETFEKKFNESNKSIENLKSMTQDKENVINTQKESFKVYDSRINDLELKLAESIINSTMKDDEFESLLMIIQYILSKKADKFEQNLSKVSPDTQQILRKLVKQYKIFK